jgi:tetraacyldisaccharide 4'-kinase
LNGMNSVLRFHICILSVFDPSSYHELVSGRRQGAVASMLRGTLGFAEIFYAAAVRWRNRRYDLGKAATHRIDVPVISVGNLTLGGTGKTPLVRWLAQWFQAHGVPVAIVSRGYGSKDGAANDEALEMRQSLPDVPHVQNPDRVTAAQEAIHEFGSRLILLDDGFQHRRIARDLDIVLLDASAPFGYGRVFPRGLLREPVEGLRRADVVILSRADLLDPAGRAAVWKTVQALAPAAIRAEAIHAPRTLISAVSTTLGWQLNCRPSLAVDTIHGQSVAAFCGIGNPAGFRHTLERCGCRIAGFREFPDHHRYSPSDVESLTEWAAGLGVSAVLCTHKDLVKLSNTQLGQLPLWAVGIELQFLAGQEALEPRLRAIIETNSS